MAGKLIELTDAAQMLGVTADELNEMRSRGEVYGYRDGSTWKFKKEELDRVAEDRGIQLGGEATPPAEGGSAVDADLDELFEVAELEPAEEEAPEQTGPEGETESILVTEEELGHSGETTSSTIIGKSDKKASPGESDLKLADESSAPSGGGDVELVADAGAGSDVKLVPGGSDVLASGADQPAAGDTGDAQGASGADDVNLDMELDLGDDLSLDEDEQASEAGSAAADSNIDLAAIDEDDDSVLSGTGSDVTLGAADSGISLTSPADSGLSLEQEPLELGDSAGESLELGEDDMIPLEEDATDPEAATQLKADDDFLLTPVEDAELDESDSGSQVIALDADEFEDAPGTIQVTEGPGALEEQVAAEGLVDVAGPDAAAIPAPARADLPDAPYSIWNVMSLVLVTLLLGLTSMMMMDLLFHIHTWDDPAPMSSPIMDAIINMFGGK